MKLHFKTYLNFQFYFIIYARMNSNITPTKQQPVPLAMWCFLWWRYCIFVDSPHYEQLASSYLFSLISETLIFYFLGFSNVDLSVLDPETLIFIFCLLGFFGKTDLYIPLFIYHTKCTGFAWLRALIGKKEILFL